MNDRESGIEGYLLFLQTLWPRCPTQFLFGGQAVNFWAEYFDRQGRSNSLHELRPFTSKDCDIWVSPAAWVAIRKTESTRLVLGESPADGQLGVLTLLQSPLRVVDLMSGVTESVNTNLPGYASGHRFSMASRSSIRSTCSAANATVSSVWTKAPARTHVMSG